MALPEKFRALPKGTVHDYIATMTRNWADVVKVVKDPEAETGIANKLDLTADYVDGREKYVLPMPWGLYATVDKKFPGNPTKSYRSREPLRVTGEVTDWQGHSPRSAQSHEGRP